MTLVIQVGFIISLIISLIAISGIVVAFWMLYDIAKTTDNVIISGIVGAIYGVMALISLGILAQYLGLVVFV